MVHSLVLLAPPGPSIHSAAYGSSRVEHRACTSVCGCVCVCAHVHTRAELTEKGRSVTSLMLVNLIAGGFFHDKGNLLALSTMGHL